MRSVTPGAARARRGRTCRITCATDGSSESPVARRAAAGWDGGSARRAAARARARRGGGEGRRAEGGAGRNARADWGCARAGRAAAREEGEGWAFRSGASARTFGQGSDGRRGWAVRGVNVICHMVLRVRARWTGWRKRRWYWWR